MNKIHFIAENGEYWRLLTPGTYKIWVEKDGYYPSTNKTVEIKYEKYNEAMKLDFKLNKKTTLRKYVKFYRNVNHYIIKLNKTIIYSAINLIEILF